MRSADRLPHALLLRGPAGVGKQRFAERLAAELLCTDGSDEVCGECKNCKLLAAGSHPDFYRVSPAEEGKSIGIEQIRALIASLNLTTSVGTLKLGIISPAERMTVSAANSLLKTLEEPPGSALLVLVSGLSDILPATVRSRCQTLLFPAVHTPQTIDWLRSRLDDQQAADTLLSATNGQPLTALQWAETGALETRAQFVAQLADIAAGTVDAVQAAQDWKKLGAEPSLDTLTSTLLSLAQLQLNVAGRGSSASAPEIILQALAEQLDLQGLFSLYDKCVELRRLLTTHPGLNEQLQLEAVAVRWQAISRHAPC